YSTGITAGAQPLSITADSNGHLFFTEPPLGNIALITTSGTVTETNLGLFPSTLPAVICLGFSGNLYVTGNTSSSQIVQIVTFQDGTIQTLTGFPVNGDPVGIASVANGDLWFCESTSSKIGTITAF